MAWMRWPRVVAVVVLGGAVPACAPRVAVEELPTSRQTMEAVGVRLGRSHSPRELTRMAARGRRLLRALTGRERDALGRNLIRFRVDRPVFVEVAVPVRSVPFWLDEQGFANSHITLANADGPFVLYHKSYPPGWVGLGVNGLGPIPTRITPCSSLPRDADRPPAISDLTPATIRPVRAEEGVSPFVDAHKPFSSLPFPLPGSTILQTCFAERGATVLALGGPGRSPSRSVKVTMVSAPTPAIRAARSRPARRARVVPGSSARTAPRTGSSRPGRPSPANRSDDSAPSPPGRGLG
jgi:hypothetical protein